MVKCTKREVRRLKTALRWKGDPKRRQRIQMVLLRESWMSQPAIAEAILLSRSGPARPTKSSHGVRARYNARILK
jgi:hypothetical protein